MKDRNSGTMKNFQASSIISVISLSLTEARCKMTIWLLELGMLQPNSSRYSVFCSYSKIVIKFSESELYHRFRVYFTAACWTAAVWTSTPTSIRWQLKLWRHWSWFAKSDADYESVVWPDVGKIWNEKDGCKRRNYEKEKTPRTPLYEYERDRKDGIPSSLPKRC